MPALSVWWLRAALIHLAAGFTVGALLLFHKGVPLHPALWRLLPTHMELLLLGWTLNLALGVAYWILPRFKTGPPRGQAWPVVTAFALLNAGVIAVCVAPWVSSVPEAVALITWLGRLAETLAALVFAVHALPRIKAHGQ